MSPRQVAEPPLGMSDQVQIASLKVKMPQCECVLLSKSRPDGYFAF